MLNISFTSTVRKCTNCGISSGHNRATCPLLPCSVCREIGHTLSMCPTLREQRLAYERSRRRIENMSPAQIENQRSRDRVENMSPAQIENQRSRDRLENMSPAQIENQQSRRRLENMSSAQIENEQSRHRLENLSPAQIENQQSRHRLENMSPAQIVQQRYRGTHQNQRFLPIQQVWDDDNPCSHCHAVYLKSVSKSARKRCCNNGAYLMSDSEFPKLEPLPESLKWLCLERGEHFGKLSAKYNNILSIGSTGVENEKGGGYEKIVGDSAVKMNGRSYHFLNTSARKMSGINYYTFDSLQDAQAHAQSLNSGSTREQRYMKKLEIGFLTTIYHELKGTNPFAQELQWIGQGLRRSLQQPNSVINMEEVHHLTASLNVQTSTMEVGCMLSDESEGNIIYKFNVKGMSHTISSASDVVEPLCYVLLFPFAERGWCRDISKSIGFMSYMCSRLKMPERTYESDFDPVNSNQVVYAEDNPHGLLRQWNKSNTKLLATNRFQLMHRLSQYYLVEQLSRALDFKLQWHKKNRGYIFGERSLYSSSALDDANEQNDYNGPDNFGEEGFDDNDNSNGKKKKSTFLASSFNGSPRHLNDLAHNALTIVTELGKPDLFITGTCNPLWPEIEERLFKGQTAYDRPDIVCEVFHARLEALLHNLRSGKYFGFRKTAYDIRVIEYQHRGLPHFHLVCKLQDMPDREDSAAVVAWIDEFIQAKMPSEDDSEYYACVERHMTHVCSNAVNGCLDKEGNCKRGYKRREVMDTTTLDENGYPIYRRPNRADLKVVPHNREVLLDWDGHINVEYAGTSYTVLYLYKYLFKGNRKVKATFQELNESQKVDEFFMYLRGRYICSMESTWKFFHFQTYPATKPSVSKITVKLPSHVDSLLNDGMTCDIGIYFARPLLFAEYKYTEFFKHFAYSRKLPARFRNSVMWDLISITSANSGTFDFQNFCIDISAKFPFLNGSGKRLYLFSRDSTKAKSIVRMNWVFPSAGEIFYLRILLFNLPAMSFQDYRTVNNIEFKTFQLAAVARNLVDDDREAYLAFQNVILMSTPAELRSLLVLLTVEGYPTLSIIEDEEMFRTMYDDYLHLDNECIGNIGLAKNKCLLDLKRRFDMHGEDIMEACGFPLPIASAELTELDRIRLKYEPSVQKQLLDQYLRNSPNTDEQESAFQEVKRALEEDRGCCIFIQGSAGTGKSTFARKLTALARSMGKVALGCAATALAAQVYGEEEEFTTAHDLFGIPVIEDNEDIDHEADIVSNYVKQLKKLAVLLEASLYVWDEILSNHKHCLATAFSVCEFFRNKIVILMGDWRQCPPVVRNGDMYEIVHASMKYSRFWSRFRVVKFTKNLRLVAAASDSSSSAVAAQFVEQQKEYLDMLNIIGEGKDPAELPLQSSVAEVYGENVQTDGSRIVALPSLNSTSNMEEMLAWLFPEGFNPDLMHTKAILAATNTVVDEWNTVIQNLNSNIAYELCSIDKVKDIDDPHGILQRMISESVLERFQRPGVPNHRLVLKKDDICMVMRNLNKREGIAKNTRVKIVHISLYIIRVCTLHPTNPKYYNIPRIRFTVTLPYGRSIKMERRQFPLRLAYSMTYNKSQGQEFDKVCVDIRKHPFTHGHLYVALSRIRIASNLRLFTNPQSNTNTDEFPEPPIVTNVVYKQLSI